MTTAETILQIGAWLFGAITVLLLAGGFVLGPALEHLGARRYARENAVIQGTCPARRGMGERLTGAAHWLAVKATRADRTGADHG